MIDGHCLVTLPCTINETFKWLTSLAHLNAEIVYGDDSVAVRYKLPLPSPLFPPTVGTAYVNPTLNLINNNNNFRRKDGISTVLIFVCVNTRTYQCCVYAI